MVVSMKNATGLENGTLLNRPWENRKPEHLQGKYQYRMNTDFLATFAQKYKALKKTGAW